MSKGKKNKAQPKPHTKINSKWVIYLNVKCSSIKLPQRLLLKAFGVKEVLQFWL